MMRGLVLGGGGLIGMAYHAGALKGLAEVGFDPSTCDLMIGTSAGSVMASYMAAGWTPDDFYDYAFGRHPDAEKEESGQRAEVRRIFNPLWSGPGERTRRAIGSFFAVASSRGWLRSRWLPDARLRRAFPSGMYSTDETRERFRRDLPNGWPTSSLYICTAELYSGKRVAFGSSGAPKASLPDAVLASTAIPGVFPPVRIGDHYYVDGGIASATSLDLAVEAGCRAVLCVAPLGYRIDEATLARDPRLWPSMLVRSMFARTLRKEVVAARGAGVDVMVIRPWLTELKAHGTNSMRHFDRKSLVESARVGTLRLLEENDDHPVLNEFLTTRTTVAGGGGGGI